MIKMGTMYLMLNCELKDLSEGVDRVLATDGVSLVVANMIVSGKQNSKCVFSICMQGKVFYGVEECNEYVGEERVFGR